MKTKKFNVKKLVVFIFIILFLGIFIFSGINIVIYLKDNYQNKKIQDNLQKEAITIVESGEDVIQYEIDFTSLKQENNDVVAYIKVNGTNIDYVVVRGKDNSYYLNHNLKKKSNKSGWIFADYRNKFDENDRNIVLFGHNTRDGSMFGTLRNVLKSDWQKKEDNQIITLVTEKGTYYYQVFSSYSIIPEDYYINTEFKNDVEFDTFIKKIKSRSVYDYHVLVDGSDKILTLSSCTSNGTKRVVLHAKLIIPED